MRNFDTLISEDAGYAILDEDTEELEDQSLAFLLDEDLVTENVWGNEELIAGTFLKLEFDTTLYCSSYDVDLYHSGQKYQPTEFRVVSMDFGSDLSVDQCVIEIANTDLSMSGILLNNDENGSLLTLYIGAVSASTYGIYDLHPFFSGELTGWPDLTRGKARLVYSGLMARWSKKTLRISQASCPWPQGGDDCGYSGGGVCQQMFSNCKDFGNNLNFGGFPYLPELMEKKIYWGHLEPK